MSEDTTSSKIFKHGHIHIRPATLEKGLEDVFQEDYHSAAWLTRTAISHSQHRGPQLARLQKLALHRYHQDSIFDITSPSSHLKDLPIITAYGELFNELFFFGSLKSRIHVMFKDKIESSDKELWGEVIPHDDGNSGLKILRKIIRSPNPRVTSYDLFIYSLTREYPNRTDRLIQYVSGLLHEMLHIYFNLWHARKVVAVMDRVK